MLGTGNVPIEPAASAAGRRPPPPPAFISNDPGSIPAGETMEASNPAGDPEGDPASDLGAGRGGTAALLSGLLRARYPPE